MIKLLGAKVKHQPLSAESDPRYGFSIIELLVSIGIIGVIMALTLPAVQASRESARVVQCTNNIKLLALGCLHHETAHGRLPTGGWSCRWQGDPDRGFGRAQPGGWTYNILPYIEQQALHDLGSGKSVADKKKDLAIVAQTPLSVFYCPTRRGPDLLPVNESSCNSDPIKLGARTDYAGNSGTKPVAWFEPPTTGDPSFFDQPDYLSPNYDAQYDGVFAPLSLISIDAITDSTSYTFLLGEKYLNQTNGGGPEPSDNNAIYSGFDWDWQRWGHNAPQRDRPGHVDNTSFGSSHTGGVNMAMCDGSVRSIGFEIDDATFALLCGRSNGEASLPGK